MPDVRYELDGKVARVTLDRPEKFNALTLEMLDSIAMSITDAEERCARVWVITGSGNSFCSGGDIELMKEALAGDVKRMFQSLTGKLRKCVVSIVKSPLICIASIPGVAVGAGAVMDGDSSCAGGGWGGGDSVVKAPTLLQAL